MRATILYCIIERGLSFLELGRNDMNMSMQVSRTSFNMRAACAMHVDQ
jgi:hypothetical protein